MNRLICWLACLSGVCCAPPAPKAPPQAAALPWRAQSRALQDSGQVAQAYALMLQQLCGDPNDLAAAAMLVEVVQLWDLQGRPHDVQAKISAHCALPMPLQLFAQGLTAAARGAWEPANAALAAAQTQMPAMWQAELALHRARVALHSGQSQAALQIIEQALKHQPGSTTLRLLLAQTCLGQNAPDAAVDALRPLLALTPTAEELSRARSLMASAIAAGEPPPSPANSAAVQELLVTLQQEAPAAEEIANARLLVSAAPHPRVWTLAGLLALRLGATDEGVTWLHDALAANHLDPDPARILAGHYLASQDEPQALAMFKEAWHRNPFDAELAGMVATYAAAARDQTAPPDSLLAPLDPRQPAPADKPKGAAAAGSAPSP